SLFLDPNPFPREGKLIVSELNFCHSVHDLLAQSDPGNLEVLSVDPDALAGRINPWISQQWLPKDDAGKSTVFVGHPDSIGRKSTCVGRAQREISPRSEVVGRSPKFIAQTSWQQSMQARHKGVCGQ